MTTEQGLVISTDDFNRERCKRLIYENIVELNTWNIGALIWKMEIFDTMIRRKIHMIRL